MSSPVARSAAVALIGLSLIAADCGSSSSSRPIGVPGPGPARAALDASLRSWREGRRGSGGLIGAGPAVGVVDSLRPGRPLDDFEILGPPGIDGPARAFAVRLRLGEPAETLTTRYLVLGRDPLWVFRREDYDLILHWEHAMLAPADAEGSGPR